MKFLVISLALKYSLCVLYGICSVLMTYISSSHMHTAHVQTDFSYHAYSTLRWHMLLELVCTIAIGGNTAPAFVSQPKKKTEDTEQQQQRPEQQ